MIFQWKAEVRIGGKHNYRLSNLRSLMLGFRISPKVSEDDFIGLDYNCVDRRLHLDFRDVKIVKLYILKLMN